MQIGEIVNLIENFAPLESQENWDCAGYQLDFGKRDIKKVLLCVSVTENIINQAIEKHCDMIIAHHPLFFIPFSLNKDISVYSAHTNLDKADGGTTDSLIKLLGFSKAEKIGDFLRVVELQQEILLDAFINLLKDNLKLENIRVVNNFNKQKISKIAFCAGSGADFLNEAERASADIFVTGDVKYHQALESNVIIADVGHFESEHPVLVTIKELLEPLRIEVVIAEEKSPFINY